MVIAARFDIFRIVEIEVIVGATPPTIFVVVRVIGRTMVEVSVDSNSSAPLLVKKQAFNIGYQVFKVEGEGNEIYLTAVRRYGR